MKSDDDLSFLGMMSWMATVIVVVGVRLHLHGVFHDSSKK